MKFYELFVVERKIYGDEFFVDIINVIIVIVLKNSKYNVFIE